MFHSLTRQAKEWFGLIAFVKALMILVIGKKISFLLTTEEAVSLM
jgi:hypothetical protein